MGLTAAQLNQYRRDGFVLLEGLISEEKIARWSRRFEDLVLEKVEHPEKLVIMKDVFVAKGEVVPASPLHAITKILSFEEDPVLWQYTLDEALLDAVQSIVGEGLFTGSYVETARQWYVPTLGRRLLLQQPHSHRHLQQQRGDSIEACAGELLATAARCRALGHAPDPAACEALGLALAQAPPPPLPLLRQAPLSPEGSRLELSSSSGSSCVGAAAVERC